MSDNYNANEIRAAIGILQKVLANMEGFDKPEDAEAERKAVQYDPTPASHADLVSPKQLGLIRHLAREAGVDADLECAFVMKVKTHELSKKAASQFIDHLKGLEAKKGAAA